MRWLSSPGGAEIPWVQTALVTDIAVPSFTVKRTADLVTCRREFVTGVASQGVLLLPPDRSGAGRIGVDVTAQLAGEAGGSEDTACDHFLLDYGEPDLVPLRGIGWRGEVEIDGWMLLQELPY